MIRRLFERLGLVRKPLTSKDVYDLWVAQGGTITPKLREAYAAYKRNKDGRK